MLVKLKCQVCGKYGEIKKDKMVRTDEYDWVKPGYIYPAIITYCHIKCGDKKWKRNEESKVWNNTN